MEEATAIKYYYEWTLLDLTEKHRELFKKLSNPKLAIITRACDVKLKGLM